MKRSQLMIPLALSLAALIFSAGILVAQTPPDKFLGFKVGEDRKLADYTQIKAYFEKLAQETNKLKLFTIGESVLKKPMIMAAISTPENLAKLDRWKEITHKLRDPRVTPLDEARKLAKEGKVIVLITCSLHATEIAASQMSMELAYDLVTGKTFFDAGKILNDVIFLLVPTHNPDGNQMVVDWYRKYVGTQYEGGNMPWLYHYYAGHDDNRDWYMFNLPETRAVTKVLYQDWLPQIHLDEHQQGSNGARLFVPPFMDPPLPNIQPSVWRGVNLIGTEMSYDLQKQGMSGVVNGRSYTAWWIGACDDTGWLHNVLGCLSEAASVRVASPIFIEPTEIQSGFYEKRMDFVDPWPGGWWRLRDIVDYELVLSQSLIKTAALHKEDILFNFYQMYKNSVEKVDKGQPYAFVIPAIQRDYPTMLKMLEVLKMGGVEIHQAKADFIAGGRFYNGGLVRRQDGAALQDLRLGAAREAEVPRHAAIPRRPAGPALRQRGLDAAPADGRPLRQDRRRLRSQAGEARRGPLPQGPAAGKERLLHPRLPGQRVLCHGHRPAQGRRRDLPDEDRGLRSRATTSRPALSSSRTRPR